LRPAVASLPFRAHIYHNSQVSAAAVVCSGLRHGGCYSDVNSNQCGFTKIGNYNLTWGRAAALCHAAGFTVAGAEGDGSE
jgi:hypothetical protein